MKSKTLALLLWASLAAPSFAELMPAARLYNWVAGETVGVPDGIEQYQPGGANARTTLIDVTQAPYSADNTGVTDSAEAIQDAIDAAASEEVVYLPAGTYRLDSPLVFGAKDNITLRGDGETTILDARSSGNVISVGTGSDYLWNYPDYAITGSPTKGGTVLTMATTEAFDGYPSGGNLRGYLCPLPLR